VRVPVMRDDGKVLCPLLKMRYRSGDRPAGSIVDTADDGFAHGRLPGGPDRNS